MLATATAATGEPAASPGASPRVRGPGPVDPDSRDSEVATATIAIAPAAAMATAANTKPRFRAGGRRAAISPRPPVSVLGSGGTTAGPAAGRTAAPARTGGA